MRSAKRDEQRSAVGSSSLRRQILWSHSERAPLARSWSLRSCSKVVFFFFPLFLNNTLALWGRQIYASHVVFCHGILPKRGAFVSGALRRQPRAHDEITGVLPAFHHFLSRIPDPASKIVAPPQCRVRRVLHHFAFTPGQASFRKPSTSPRQL